MFRNWGPLVRRKVQVTSKYGKKMQSHSLAVREGRQEPVPRTPSRHIKEP